MDKLASVLKLAKEIVALLEAPNTEVAKNPTHTAAQTKKIMAAAEAAASAAAKVMGIKKTPATKPAKSAKPVKPMSSAAQEKALNKSLKKEEKGTFSMLPKNKQVYLNKKVKEVRAYFKRHHPNVNQQKLNKLIEDVRKNCISMGHVTYPVKHTMKDWKEYTDEQFNEAFGDDDSDDESNDESSDPDEIKYEYHV